ncbi:MAG: hypothetical protein F2667_12460 [Actinobacteria bacterium]|uniref:Unannotated protein n=1 Tax=freshwater metagenome TaxID=449393 RepID=A0A6J6RYK8_9ZZZZ|nr:hypothetical protein [Actinomycetota bacterium]
MIRLLSVELTRLRWRRAVLMLIALAVVVPAVMFAATAWNTRPVSDQELEQARSQLDNRYSQRDLRQCAREPQNYGLDLDAGEAGVAEACEQQILSWYVSRTPLDLAGESKEGTLLGVAAVVCLLMLLAGTTFVGHDWNSGSMSNQLLFESRRLRVWAAKAIAVSLVALLLGAVVMTLYWMGLRGLAGSRDLPIPVGVTRDGLQVCARVTALAAGSALGGFALTMLLRSTVATLGVLFAVSIAGGTIIGIIGSDGSARWQPQYNLAAVVAGDVTYYDQSSVPTECLTGQRVPVDVDCDGEQTISAAQGATYSGVVLALVCGASVASYRRRDVP